LATVITNLLSAIPVFGQDLVELIWGGFSVLLAPHYSDVKLQILLFAGTSSITAYALAGEGVGYVSYYHYRNVKKPTT